MRQATLLDWGRFALTPSRGGVITARDPGLAAGAEHRGRYSIWFRHQILEDRVRLYRGVDFDLSFGGYVAGAELRRCPRTNKEIIPLGSLTCGMLAQKTALQLQQRIGIISK